MRRGFSLYAPLVGIILLSVALLILASFISEENARISYLRAIRASYAYLLPTYSMKYDAFTAFSVSARLYFQNRPVEPGEEPDIGELLDNFLSGFTTIPAGGGIKEARIIWDENSVTIQEKVEDNYILLEVTVNQPPGPLYFITIDAGGREENVEVPIFEQETTVIYIPYPYGRVQQIAEKIKRELGEAARDGNIAYGYCSKVLEEVGEAREVYIVLNEKSAGGKEELKEALKNLLEDIASPLGAHISDVRTKIKTRNEVNMIRYISVDINTLLCMLPYNLRRLANICNGAYIPVGETVETCAYVTSIGVEGSVNVGEDNYVFDVVVQLADDPAPSPYKTMRLPRFNLKEIIDPDTNMPAYCYNQSSSCTNCLDECMQECAQRIINLVSRLSQVLRDVQDADDLGELDIYCPIGIRTAVLCDAESEACHYRNREGNRGR